jgi:hypothetical protein
MSLPADLQADNWRLIAQKQTLRREALEQLGEVTAPPLIERERARYVGGTLEIDEFELRVDTILRGLPSWWEG